ncbi:GNAT family N-acetyltransferase [Natrialbaceae archaeon A-CW1-1]
MDVVIAPAEQQHVDGICRVCAEGWRETYAGILPDEEIEATIEEFYTPERVAQEVRSPEDWDGWLVALNDKEVVGAGGGGLTEPNLGEVFVLYVAPSAKRRGIGTRLLEAITKQQLEHGATEQWVSIVPNNKIGKSFYQKHGFESVGEREAYSDTSDRNSLRLKRSV